MKPTDQFHSLLESTSLLSNLQIEIWDKGSRIFGTYPENSEEDVLDAHWRLVCNVVKNPGFHNGPCLGRYIIYGMVLMDAQRPVGALLAYSAQNDQQGPTPFGNSSQPMALLPAEEIEHFLYEYAHMIEEDWLNREEVENMAEELSTGFEDLSLYASMSCRLKPTEFSCSTLQTLLAELQNTLRIDLAFAELPGRIGFNATANAPAVLTSKAEADMFAEALVRTIPTSAFCSKDEYLIISNSQDEPAFAALHPKPYRFLFLKIQNGTRDDGWLGLVSFNVKQVFRQSELQLLKAMSQQISTTLTNDDMFRDLEQFVISMVRSLVYTIEAKDLYTRSHSARVNKYSLLMAKRMNLGQQETEALTWASMLHDIGKIGIPEKILNKTGRLTPEEYALVRTHPEKGHNILTPLAQLANSLPGVLHHHERFDGTGYPSGLKGQEIPLLARIIAVPDTFDALTSCRAYRSPRSAAAAIQIMERASGTQLDPDMFKVFMSIYNEILSQEFKNQNIQPHRKSAKHGVVAGFGCQQDHQLVPGAAYAPGLPIN